MLSILPPLPHPVRVHNPNRPKGKGSHRWYYHTGRLRLRDSLAEFRHLTGK